MKFLFELPQHKDKLSPMATDALNIAYLVERLANEPRKRVAHTSERPENVAEHTLMVGKIAIALAQKYYPDLDIGKVAAYALGHDDIEAYVGDTPSGEWCNTDYESKESREALGAEQLEKEYGDTLPQYVEEVREYERQEDPEARFVRAVDKLAVNLMHVVDDGKEVNRHFTLEAYLSNEKHRREKMNDYDDWREIVDLMPEIANYIAAHLIKKDDGDE